MTTLHLQKKRNLKNSYFFVLVALALFSSCDDDFPRVAVTDNSVDPIFLVSLYNLNTDEETDDLQEYVSNINAVIADYNGNYVYSPIENQGNLDNESSPSVLTPFPGDYLTLIRFQNQAFLDAFLQDEEQRSIRENWQGRIDIQNRFTVIEQPGADGNPANPIVAQEDLAADPPARNDGILFSLVGISFSPDPADQVLLDSFFMSGIPLLFQAGLSFSGSFFKVADIEGSFDYAALNFALYNSSTAFFEVHNTDPFRQLANTLRNPTLTAFAENQGRVTVEISIE